MTDVADSVKTSEQRRASPGAKLAIDLGPLGAFFAVNAWKGVFFGTGAFMIAMAISMIVSKLRYRHISPMLWFSGAAVLILGGITIWLHDETFIKIKPTLYYTVIAGLLLFGLWTRRNLLETVLGSVYPGLSERGWRLLTRNWALFFIVMAVLNEAVWRNTSTGFWIGFKLWGFLPATFLFALANVPMLVRHGAQIGKDDEPPVPPSQ